MLTSRHELRDTMHAVLLRQVRLAVVCRCQRLEGVAWAWWESRCNVTADDVLNFGVHGVLAAQQGTALATYEDVL